MNIQLEKLKIFKENLFKELIKLLHSFDII